MITMGQQVITNPGQVPVPFEIRYDPASLDPRHTYAIQADITAGSSLMFTQKILEGRQVKRRQRP